MAKLWTQAISAEPRKENPTYFQGWKLGGKFGVTEGVSSLVYNDENNTLFLQQGQEIAVRVMITCDNSD